MKKFKFRLDRVLQYRNIVKDEKRREFTKRLLVLREAQDRLEWLNHAWFQNQLESEQILQVEFVVMRGLYAARLRAEIGAQRDLIEELEEVVEAAKQEYIEASKEVEVLEKLKTKKKEEYTHEMDMLEGKVLDELSVQRRDFIKE